MSKFIYRIKDKDAKLLEGIMDATSEEQARTFLQEREYEILLLKVQSEGFSFQKLQGYFEKVKPTEFNFFIRQMATLLKAGVPMLTCLKALQEEMQDKVLRTAVDDIYHHIEQGNSFSESLSRHPRIFSQLFVSTVKGGEAIGELDMVLSRLADVLDKDYQIRSKIQAALRYPMLVICVMIMAFLVATLFIIPRFKDLFSVFGSNLPLPTRILVTISEGVVKYWFVLLLFGIGLAIVYAYHKRTASGRRFWDGLFLRVQVLGQFIRYGVFSRFSRMLGIMLKSGVNILQGLDLVAQIVDNSVISDAILRIKQRVSEGDALSLQMRKEGFFPSLLIQMVYAGESSGKMDELLLQIAEHYDAELELMTKNMESLIEPFFILMLGGFIIIMALGIFLPMWDVYTLIASQASS